VTTPTKRQDSGLRDDDKPGDSPIDPWTQLDRLASVFRYRGEAERDPELQAAATALEALSTPQARPEVVKAARRELKRLGEPLTIRASADAMLAAVEQSLRRSEDPQRVATDIVTELIKYPALQARAKHWPRFTDAHETHEEAIAEVAWAIEDHGAGELRDPRRMLIGAMRALGDDNAENLFAG